MGTRETTPALLAAMTVVAARRGLRAGCFCKPRLQPCGLRTARTLTAKALAPQQVGAHRRPSCLQRGGLAGGFCLQLGCC